MVANLFTRSFILVSLATFAFFFSLLVIMPVLPFYVVDLGGDEVMVGITVGLFTISALAARLFVGAEIDRRGRKAFMISGSAIFVVSSLLYLLPHTIVTLLAVRLIHGTGIAAFTTSATTYVADTAPPARRGEAMSLFGLANNGALATAPVVGSLLHGSTGFAPVFVAAGIAAAGALLLCLKLPDSPGTHSPGVTGNNMVSRAAIFPSITLVSGTMLYGMVVAYLPLIMAERRLGSSGLYFSLLAVGLIVARIFGGRISDKFGRHLVIQPGSALMAAAMLLVAFAGNWMTISAAALLHGAGFGLFYPGLLSWTVDRAKLRERGKAMALITAAFDVGVGLGTAGLGWLAAFGFGPLFVVGAGIGLVGVLMFEVGNRFHW